MSYPVFNMNTKIKQHSLDKGSESENYAAQYLESEYKKAFSHVHVINGAIFKPNDNLMPSTTEADTIIICEAGIYIFEVKSWNGHITQIDGVFTVSEPGKAPSQRNNPIHQNTRKCRYIKKLVPGVNVQNRVLITGPKATLDYQLPPLLMTSWDIAHSVRAENYIARHKANLLSCEQILSAYQTILAAIGDANVTLDEHIANCNFYHHGQLAHAL